MHYTPRGVDVDSTGLVWTELSGSGELASFDRRKCKVLNGPTATGQHCPEGWTIYPVPGPGFKGTEAKADWFYLNWVDRYNTLGLGKDVSVVLGTGSDSLHFFKPDTKEWITVRVPYPMGLLHPRYRRAHRRSQNRLEGPRAVGDYRNARDLALRRRQGTDASNGAFPGSA